MPQKIDVPTKAWQSGHRVSHQKSNELGTIVEALGKVKVKWDGGRTSYFDRGPSNLRQELHPSIPRVMCPRCGTKMRLSQIEPSIDGRDVAQFDCGCGFEYQMSASAAPRTTMS